MINPKYKNVFMSPGSGNAGNSGILPHHDPRPFDDPNQPTKTKKSLITAVKKLLAKLGAEEVEGNNLVEVIDSGADAIEGSGDSGSNSLFVFTITATSEEKDPPIYSCDKTHTEIYNAAQNSAVVCRIVSIHDGLYEGATSCGNVNAGNTSVIVTIHQASNVETYNIMGSTVTHTYIG